MQRGINQENRARGQCCNGETGIYLLSRNPAILPLVCTKPGLGGGIGLQNSLLYELIDFNFLHIGNTSVWMPIAIMVMAVLEIPVFLGLTVYSYCRKKKLI